MYRLPLLVALLLVASDARAQAPPQLIADADNYVISVRYREAPTGRTAARSLHMAYVTVTPSTSRPRAPWSGTLRAIRFSPARSAYSDDGVVWLRQTERGQYAGYGFVPAPVSMTAVSFADLRDVSAAYDLNPNEAYGDDSGGDSGGDTGGEPKDPGGDPKDPGDGSGGEDPGEPPGGDDDLINPWDPEPEPTPPTKPKPEWPENPGDDLVNPWPGRTSFSGSTFYFLF